MRTVPAFALAAAFAAAAIPASAFAGPSGPGGGAPTLETPTMPDHDGVHQFTLKTLEGKDKSLADYSGKVLLLVNVASKCGFTPQYKGLEDLYLKYKGRGLDVLGFPSNDFNHQEPGTDAEIKEFCSTKYQVTFDLFSKIHVREEPQAPLYHYLTTQAGHDGPVSWNFNKFLVGKDGKVVARFDSNTKPDSEALSAAIEKALK